MKKHHPLGNHSVSPIVLQESRLPLDSGGTVYRYIPDAEFFLGPDHILLRSLLHSPAPRPHAAYAKKHGVFMARTCAPTANEHHQSWRDSGQC
eukprot:gene25616-biopygen13539